jgi:hypothetical protein
MIVTEAKRAANAANAKKPRLKITADLREIMREKLVPMLRGPGAARIARMLSSPDSTFDEFKWAAEFVANRLGLPLVTKQDVDVQGQQRQVWVIPGGLGWPGVKGDGAASAPGDHDGRDEQLSVQ